MFLAVSTDMQPIIPSVPAMREISEEQIGQLIFKYIKMCYIKEYDFKEPGGQVELKRSITLRFFVPYAAILLISLGIGLYFQQQTFDTMERQLINENFRVLDQSKRVLDQRFEEVKMIIQQIESDTKIKYLAFEKNPLQGNSMFDVYVTQKNLYDFKLYNNFISDYYILYQNSELVIGPNVVSSFSYFFEDLLPHQQIEYQEWIEKYVKAFHNYTYIPMMQSNEDEHQTMLTLVHSLGMPYRHYGAVLLLIDDKAIRQMLYSLDTSYGGWAFITDAEGRMIASSAEAPEQLPALLSMNGERGTENLQLANDNMLVTYMTSNTNGWKYVVVQPKALVMAKMYDLQKVIWISFVIALLFGLIVAILLAYRTSQPIRQLWFALSGKIEEGAETRDMFGQMQNTVSTIIHNNEVLQDKVDKQQPLLRFNLLHRLLQGGISTEQEIRTQMEHYHCVLPGDAFAVAVIDLNAMDYVPDETMLHDIEVKRIFAKEALEQYFAGKALWHDISEDKMAVMMVMQPETAQNVHKLHMAMRQSGVSQIISVGRTYHKLTELVHSFAEANEALEWNKRQRNQISVMYYEMMPPHVAYHYPAELQLRLMNFVRDGSTQELNNLLAQLHKENMQQRTLSISMMKFFLLELQGTMIKLGDLMDVQAPLEKGLKTYELEQLASVSELERFYRQLAEQLSAMCEQIHARKANRHTELIEEVCNYLQEAYCRSEMSLSHVADRFNISDVYLSQLFKEYKNDNFFSYVEQLRMEKAKGLLTDKTFAIQEIAETIGYQSANTFGRAFKRLYGMSPSAYRNLN
ncbi:helix-turn-helix domain-containing protein [Paenibacillus spongiae]|uniref:Helix-turn-helix domain-containing protein n=1 Tax=Paenibacillus spongiae TaxID=2909671 RepID=A0ABY5S434_9BACL|nr:helix-turn-helix domain-containing protein [Paenibacillus spongiae]UVI28459.1 helix-turn-helix domain-containing protein [Paenibacillus spongiae]